MSNNISYGKRIQKGSDNIIKSSNKSESLKTVTNNENDLDLIPISQIKDNLTISLNELNMHYQNKASKRLYDFIITINSSIDLLDEFN